MITRRGLISGLVGLVAAPAIVRASSLMPVVGGDTYTIWEYRLPLLPSIDRLASERPQAEVWRGYLSERGNLCDGIWTFFGKDHNIYSDTEIGFRKEEIPGAFISMTMSA